MTISIKGNTKIFEIIAYGEKVLKVIRVKGSVVNIQEIVVYGIHFILISLSNFGERNIIPNVAQTERRNPISNIINGLIKINIATAKKNIVSDEIFKSNIFATTAAVVILHALTIEAAKPVKKA